MRQPDHECLLDRCDVSATSGEVWDVPCGCPLAGSPEACARHVPTDVLIAAHVHACNARPLFGVLDEDLDTIVWRAGGVDFAGIAGPHGQETLAGLMAGLGVTRPGRRRLLEAMRASPPGAAGGPIEFRAAGGRAFALVFRRRPCPPHEVQFTLTEITSFTEAARRARFMAGHVVQALETETLPGDSRTALAALRELPEALAALRRQVNDRVIADQASRLAARVDAVAELAVHLLRGFQADEEGPSRHQLTWRGYSLAAGGCGWRDTLEGAVSGRLPLPELLQAWTFARYAQPTLLVSPDGRRVLVVNGAHSGVWFEDVAALLTGLEVESNSRRTAADFFAAIAAAPTDAAFVVGQRTMEARGGPIPGGWQALLMPASQPAIDVRGLFHGLKNLLLNLQVLHVVRSRHDLQATGGALSEAAARLLRRLETLENLARTGRLDTDLSVEKVEDWLTAARRVAEQTGRRLRDEVPAGLRAMGYRVVPEEMGDALAELARNAFEQGADTVWVSAAAEAGRMTLVVRDDGPGMTTEKLSQVREVLASGRYDPHLSTRPGGTGNGLLAAAKAVSRLLGGALEIDSGPGGTVCRLRMDLPPGQHPAEAA